jgi:hypothetical protein
LSGLPFALSPAQGRFEVEPVGSAGLLAKQINRKVIDMKSLKVALSFNRMNDGDLSAFTNNVVTCMTGNASFAKPPVALTDLTKLQDTFDKAVAAALDGGTALTAAKNAARDALLSALQKTAAYVQIVADGDMALLLTSGFSATKTGRTQSKLGIPLIVAVENEGTTKLMVRLQAVPNARSYEVRAINGATTPAASVISTQARRIVVGNLTPGTTYNLSARAVGGTEGFSKWCDPVSHMAI